ncbi:MAG: class I SAM-dependent methyltransferase [Isosphaeraceae bacterium]
MLLLNASYWVRNAGRIPARLRYWVWERLNPDKPWLCPGTIRYLERALRPSMVGLEFGSGRSTSWFAGKLDRLISVEHHDAWFHQVRDQLSAAKVANVDYRHIPLDHPETDPESEAYERTPAYVAVIDSLADESLDFVIVDGHYRTTCIRHALAKLKPGGLILVDDANLWASREVIPVPLSWPLVDNSGNGLKSAYIFQKPAAAAVPTAGTHHPQSAAIPVTRRD